MAWNKGKENVEGQKRRKSHLERGTLGIACMKGMCHRFMKKDDS